MATLSAEALQLLQTLPALLPHEHPRSPSPPILLPRQASDQHREMLRAATRLAPRLAPRAEAALGTRCMSMQGMKGECAQHGLWGSGCPRQAALLLTPGPLPVLAGYDDREAAEEVSAGCRSA